MLVNVKVIREAQSVVNWNEFVLLFEFGTAGCLDVRLRFFDQDVLLVSVTVQYPQVKDGYFLDLLY